MITGNRLPLQGLPTEKPQWQQELGNMITRLPDLLSYLELKQPPAALADMAQQPFPVRVTRYYADLMASGDWQDPLLSQVLPWAEEERTVAGYEADPLGEQDATALPGLIHKYRSRVLIVPTSACAIHCRYCFRRHFPYNDHRLSTQDQTHIVTYLSARPEINEVIFSGGDPLMLTDHHLQRWLTTLADIPSLTRVRFHSRLPVVLPERLTADWLTAVTSTRLQPVLVLHSNHPNEVTPVLGNALAPLRAAGLTLLNQTVLLAGINDQPEVLIELSERLFRSGVLPYYLHQNDAVAGAHHFTVSDHSAKALHQALQARLPGYLVPRLVREEPGKPAKTWLR